VAEGRLHRFQAAYIAPEEVPGVVAEIQSQRIGAATNGRVEKLPIRPTLPQARPLLAVR